jgi:hypothetical protein
MTNSSTQAARTVGCTSGKVTRRMGMNQEALAMQRLPPVPV